MTVSKFLKSTATAGALVASLALAPGQGQAQELNLVDVSYGGTGCPDDTASVLVDNQSHTFSILFDAYVVSQPGPITERRKNCDMRLLFEVPRGYQFSIAEIRYKGFADLPDYVNGLQSATYEFPLFSPEYSSRTILHGEYLGDYDRTDIIPLYSDVWSPCGARWPLAIHSAVYLYGNRSRPALMTVDSIDGKVTQIWRWQWRRCYADSEEFEDFDDSQFVILPDLNL